jgi:two-component system chemotaxis response regulator CheY
MATVLIVEDTDLQAALLRGFLRETHPVVGRARTAEEAVSLAESREPDVVIMDLHLEEGDGIDATAAISELDADPRIIVSTVAVGDGIEKRAMAAGADMYLTKPYGRGGLLAAIEGVSP